MAGKVPAWVVRYNNGLKETHYMKEPTWLQNDREGKSHREKHGGIASITPVLVDDPMPDYKPRKPSKSALCKGR